MKGHWLIAFLNHGKWALKSGEEIPPSLTVLPSIQRLEPDFSELVSEARCHLAVRAPRTKGKATATSPWMEQRMSSCVWAKGWSICSVDKLLIPLIRCVCNKLQLPSERNCALWPAGGIASPPVPCHAETPAWPVGPCSRCLVPHPKIHTVQGPVSNFPGDPRFKYRSLGGICRF